MNAARILALGGTLASALTMFGGLLDWTTVVGMAGAVMLTANVLVLAGVGRDRRCTNRSPEGHPCTIDRPHRRHQHHNVGWWFGEDPQGSR